MKNDCQKLPTSGQGLGRLPSLSTLVSLQPKEPTRPSDDNMQSGQVSNNDKQGSKCDEGRRQHAGPSSDSGWGQGASSAYEKFQRHEHRRNKSTPSDNNHPSGRAQDDVASRD